MQSKQPKILLLIYLCMQKVQITMKDLTNFSSFFKPVSSMFFTFGLEIIMDYGKVNENNSTIHFNLIITFLPEPCSL